MKIDIKPFDAEITLTLSECARCGEIGQSAADLLHLGCHEDFEYGKHTAAVVNQKEIIVRPISYAK